MNQKRIGVCVYGGSSNTADPVYLNAAFELGKGIGKRGWALVYGSGDTGMMGQAARGAEEEGADIFGVAPEFFNHPGILYQEGKTTIFTKTMRERKAFMESLSSAFVMTPGGIGTLEEFYEILTLKQLDQEHAPLVIMNIEGYYDDLIEMMKVMNQKEFITDQTMHLFHVENSPEAVLTWLDTQLGQNQ